LPERVGSFPHPLKLILRLRQGPRMRVRHVLLAGVQFVRLAQRIGAGLRPVGSGIGRATVIV
jgi:hypothetical protein